MDGLIRNQEQKLFQIAFSPIQVEIGLLEEQLQNVLQAEDNSYLQQVCDFVLRSPGKRLRPALIFLAGKISDNKVNLLPVATAVEILHLATLIHDDIIDGSTSRRGQSSVNAKFGSHLAVLMGDFCYGKSLEIISETGDDYAQLMAEIINNLVAGEFLQYASVEEPYKAMNTYWDRTYKKTAFFFSACCQMGAIASEIPSTTREVLGQYGECLGMAFQIKNDLQDLVKNKDLAEPSADSDLKNGILTLPVIHALNFSQQENLLEKIYPGQDRRIIDLGRLKEALEETGAIDYTKGALQQYINMALQSLNMLAPSPARDALESLAKGV